MMEKVVIGFSRPNSWFAPIAWLIMLTERTAFSHAYVKIRSESLDRCLIYQATGSGCFFWGEEGFLAHSKPVEEYIFEVSKEAKTAMLKWAVSSSGKPYGKKQLIGLGIKRIFSLFGIKIANPFSDKTHSYICTELASVALKELGFTLPDAQDDIGLKELRERIRLLAK